MTDSMNLDPAATMQEITSQVTECVRCNLHFSRKKAVPGEGPLNASLMFIGEGPGFFENEQGRPFVGQAGKFLEELLAKIGMDRSMVFITNVVKCRPPGNRDPLPEELAACAEFLDRQIAALNPKVIVTLGRFSMAKFLPSARISDMHGQSAWIKGRLIVPMYHPAAALHQPSLKSTIEKDFVRLPELLAQNEKNFDQPIESKPASPAAEKPAENPEQLSLF